MYSVEPKKNALSFLMGPPTEPPICTRLNGGSPTPVALVYAAWIAIAIPVAWGVSITLQKVAALF